MRFLNSILGFIDRHRDLCKNCSSDIKGLCCVYSALIEGYNIILPKQPCKYLDLETKTCTVYEERFKRNRTCSPINIAIKNGTYPEGCAYLKHNSYPSHISPKIHYDDIKDKLTDTERMTFNLMNESHHRYIIKY